MRLRRKPWIDAAMQELEGGYLLSHNLAAYKGNWQAVFPGKQLCLEIGSGKGRFITGMAELFPGQAFIGVETQSGVACYPARVAQERQLANMRIICANAEHLTDWFAPGEISELYLNFSDPWPKARHAKRRLTHRGFLVKYQQILAPGGRLHFKTDNRALFDFSLAEFQALGLPVTALSYDLHHSAYANPVQTEYEQKFSALGLPINFCEVLFNQGENR